MDLHYASAVAIAAAIRERRVSSCEVLDAFLQRVARLDGRLNAIVVRDFDRARAAADAADAALARGDTVGPLHGVPMTVKESFDVQGLPTTWGVPALKGNVAATTSTSIGRLQQAGAIVFGKSNTALLLADYQSRNDLYGATSNPWNLSHTAGGSSGGSAAVLAAGLAGLEWGSDIVGSVRVPAHYNGVYAHKPTWGIVPPAGHWISPGPRTDVSVPGPMARSAADLELALRLTAGPDGAEARAYRLELPACPHRAPRDFRVAVMLDSPHAPVDGEVRDAVDAVARHLAGEGAKVSWDARPDIDFEMLARRDVPLFFRATTSGRTPDAEYDAMWEELARLDPADDSPHARAVRATAVTHRDWLQANMRRYAMQQAWERFFGEWDVLLCPAGTTTAFPQDTQSMLDRTVQVNGRPQPMADQCFWMGMFGIPYLPATVVPAALSRDGLPIGVQIVTRQYGDLTSIKLAQLLETGYRAFVPPPLDWA
jgi:amidase